MPSAGTPPVTSGSGAYGGPVGGQTQQQATGVSGAGQTGDGPSSAQATTRNREQAAGVALPAAASQRQTAIIEQQVNHLISKSQTETRDLPGSSEPH